MVMRLHLESLHGAITAQHGTVQLIEFDGQQATLADVFDELRSLSLLESYKLVIVDQADPFVTAHRQALERYAKAPVDQATLVLRCQRWNRGNLDKLIEKVGCLIKCEPYRPAQAQKWVIERATRQYQRTLAPSAATTLVRRVGCDLMQLDSELAKLALAVNQDQSIQSSHVIEQVASQGGDEKAWAAQEAILTAILTTTSRKRLSSSTPADARSGNPQLAEPVIERIHQLIDQSGQPPVLVTYFVADLVRKLAFGSIMLKQNHGEQEIAQRFKLWGPQRDLFMRVLKQLNEHTLCRMFDQIIQFDAGAKTGRGSSIQNLECFCATLGDPT